MSAAATADDDRRRALAAARRELAQRSLIVRQAELLRAITDFHDRSGLTAGLMAVTDGIRERFRAERVAVGFVEGDAVTVAAISQQAVIDPQAPETRLLGEALREACGRGEQLRLRASDAGGAEGRDDGGDDRGGGGGEGGRADASADDPGGVGGEKRIADGASSVSMAAHRALVAGRPGTGLVTSPLCHGETVIGALLVEIAPGAGWNEAKHALLQQLCDVLAPMIRDRRAAERTLARRARDGVRDAFDTLRAPRHLTAKLAVAVLGLALTALALVPLEQRVTAAAELVPVQLRTVTAPVTGYVRSVAVGVGERVDAGQLLFELDTRDLALERDRWRSELASLVAELRAVRAAGDRKRTAVLAARREQARAELALAERRIARARVLAPHDGRVVSAELERLVGAPVERGQRLVELAPDGDHVIKLLVDERDVGLLAPGQAGSLALQARPGTRLPFAVTDIHPIAVAADGRNRFRVDAALEGTPAALLPGQTGIGKVRVGRTNAFALASRRFVGWARLRLWEWLGR